MLNTKDRKQYFEVLMALNGFNNVSDKADSMPKKNRGVSVYDNLGFYGSRAESLQTGMQLRRE